MIENNFFHLNPQTLSVLQASNEADSTLLITGSTGTGKSHLAYTIHHASSRGSSGRWFKVNLATLSENLIESELFGHERGAFTGADTKRIGRLEFCNGGTIFLDEIGELPLRLQAKLLDFIQYKKITPVGSNRDIEVNVRIIAATNRNLEAAVKAGEFRADLFHRLNVFHIHLPDLAFNPKCILDFAKSFLNNRITKTEKKIIGFSKEVEQIFRHYPWPGNLRELENVVEFSVAMERTQFIQITSLPRTLLEYAKDKMKLGDDILKETDNLVHHSQPSSVATSSMVGLLQLPITLSYHESKEAFDKAYIEQALRLCSGQINLTSRRIGLNKVSLTEKIRRHSIDWRKIRYETLGPALSQPVS